MATKLFAADIVGDAASMGNFIANILQASTEFSTTGRSLDEPYCVTGAPGAFTTTSRMK